MSNMTEEEREGFTLSERRGLKPNPYETWMVVLYTPQELDNYLAYRHTNKDNNFIYATKECCAADVIDLNYPNQSHCLVLSDGSLCLYIPATIHLNAITLIRDVGMVAASAALTVALTCGAVLDFGGSWVTQAHLISYLHTHLMIGVGKYSGNVVSMVHPLTQRFDNNLYMWQVEKAMKGMSPLECQQAMYRQNLERQNNVVTPTLKSWISTTYYQ